MSIKTIITDNSLASATIGDKTLTRRTEGGQVIYDGAAGGGGGGAAAGGSGPRAYVAFDGTAANLTNSITNSFNIASITDKGAGNYTITYTSPVSNPVINIGYQVRTSSPYHALYWGVLDQTSTYVEIALGSNNVYYDHPNVFVTVH